MRLPYIRRLVVLGFVLAWTAVPIGRQAWAEDQPGSDGDLRKQIEALRQQGEESQRLIEALQRKLDQLEKGATPPTAPVVPAAAPTSADAQSALDKAIEDLGPQEAEPSAPSPDLASAKVGKAEVKLIDISMDVLVAAGGSSAPPREIPTLQGGGHDPSRNGFSLQQAEISAAGAVDPYLYGEAHIVFLEDGVELEEAYATSLGLPAGLQVKAGYFLTEFGRVNPTHPHSWDWIDQPVTNTRMFGGDGQRGVGVRLGWLLPVPWFSELLLTMQNATGERMPSFLGDVEGVGARYPFAGALEDAGYTLTIGGRPMLDHQVKGMRDFVYAARWTHSFSPGDTTALIGLSGEYGPNRTGDNGAAWIYGGDLLVRWRPAVNEYGWPYVSWQTEVTGRDYHAVGFHAALDQGAGNPPFAVDLPERTFRDWGVTTMLVWGFVRDWALGGRFEYASSFDHHGDYQARKADPLRDDRMRVAPVLIFNPTHFSRLRFQYDYDVATHLKDGHAHSVWASVEILYGAHPAHNF